jgi:chromosome partitioning protein
MATEYYAMLGVGLLLQSIREMRQEINPDLSIMGILPTRVTHTVNARDVLKLTREQLGDVVPIFDFSIPETVKFREAAGLGKTIFEHDPTSPGALAYARLAKEVVGYGK